MSELKRVNITIPISYYEEVKAKKLNLSGLVREAIEDQLNPHKLTLSVSQKTHQLYMELFNRSEVSDKDLEPFIIDALKNYIDHIINNKKDKLEEIKSKL